MAIPKDKELYEKVKKRVYKRIPQHSAYRSGLIVKEYKQEYKKKYNSDNANEDDNAYIEFSQDGGLVNAYVGFDTNTNEFTINQKFGAELTFKTDNSERMRIASNGQVLIARTSAVSSDIRLNMTADASVSAFGTENSGTGNNYIAIFRNSSGTLIGSIIATNGAVAFNTSSAYRLKENIVISMLLIGLHN